MGDMSLCPFSIQIVSMKPGTINMNATLISTLVLLGIGSISAAFIGLPVTAIWFIVIGFILSLILNGLSLPFEPGGSASIEGHPYHHLIASKLRVENLRKANDKPWRGGWLAESAGIMAVLGVLYFFLNFLFRLFFSPA